MAQTEIRSAIIELRHAMGLTQADFGKQAGISRTSIGHFENGSRAPDPDSLIRLAHAAIGARREYLAEVFVSVLPGVREGLLAPTWSEVIDPREHPRWMHHPTQPMVLVNSPREERALIRSAPEWSRIYRPPA